MGQIRLGTWKSKATLIGVSLKLCTGPQKASTFQGIAIILGYYNYGQKRMPTERSTLTPGGVL